VTPASEAAATPRTRAATDAPESGNGPSALAVAALALLDHGLTATALAGRLEAEGARVEPATADQALRELVALGLVRIARRGAAGPEYVTTSLGGQVREQGLLAGSGEILREIERLRTDLLSTIAHELRTPLTAVRTSAGLLLDPASRPTDEQRQAMLETIERNAARMQRLVADILDITRFRSGAIRLQLRPFDASVLADEVASAIRPLALERGLRIDIVAPADGGPTVFGDHRRLEQALLNLVSNAQRFATDGGTVVIQVEADAAGDVRWAVTDDGPGIAPADQARLFERFFVGRNDRAGAREGVGLGLPTALAIAQAHGGTIDVRSLPGAGSTFTLVVPAAGPGTDASEEA
jgi:signal transduction histidine kinase